MSSLPSRFFSLERLSLLLFQSDKAVATRSTRSQSKIIFHFLETLSHRRRGTNAKNLHWAVMLAAQLSKRLLPTPGAEVQIQALVIFT